MEISIVSGKILVAIGVCIFTLAGFKAFKAVSHTMNKKREECQSSSRKEKFLLSFEQAFVWAAIWSIIAALSYYCATVFFDFGIYVAIVISLRMIAIAFLLSLARDGAYYSHSGQRGYADAYNLNQSSNSSPASPPMH